MSAALRWLSDIRFVVCGNACNSILTVEMWFFSHLLCKYCFNVTPKETRKRELFVPNCNPVLQILDVFIFPPRAN